MKMRVFTSSGQVSCVVAFIGLAAVRRRVHGGNLGDSFGELLGGLRMV